VERLNPSVVVTDIELPDRSGIELLTELHARGSRARVIVFSAHATEEHRTWPDEQMHCASA